MSPCEHRPPLLLLALLSSLSLAAADDPPPPQPLAPPITVDVPRAIPGRATLRITDRFGLPISGIHPDQIDIVEHQYGYPNVTALRESLDHDQRLRVFFIIDASDTLTDAELEIYRSAVRRTLAYLASDDHAAIVYADGHTQISPADSWQLTADYIGEHGVFYRRQQYATLEALRNKSTVHLSDLISYAQHLAKRYTDLPNLIFVLGSGRAHPSPIKAEIYDLMAEAASLRTPHFTFAPAPGPQTEPLQSLARLSGGAFTHVDSAESLTRRMIDAIDRMRMNYDVTYPPFDAKPLYLVQTVFNIHLAGSTWNGSTWFEEGDFLHAPPYQAKPTHDLPASSFAPLTMSEFFLTAFGTIIVWEVLFAAYSALSSRSKDEAS
jgi:hypothetical protein